MSQVMLFFGDVAPFLQDNPELSPATNQKLLEMLQNPTVKAYLQTELAAIVDAGETFVKATYNLEGDGPVVLRCYEILCYEILNTLTASIQVGHYPNVQAIARILSGGSPVTFQQWVEYANSCIKPGLQYFLNKLSEELSGSVAAFKAARLFLPQKVVELKPNVAAVDSLQAFPFLKKASILVNLKPELPSYLAKAADIDAPIDLLDWWKPHSADLPHWSTAAADILLVEPSLAAAEHVFSLLKAYFGSQQDASLNDYIQTSLMLQCNDR